MKNKPLNRKHNQDFPTSLPEDLSYRVGKRFLAEVDIDEITRSFGSEGLTLGKNRTTDHAIPRIVFFGSGFGELLLTRYLADKLEMEGFHFKWWFTNLSESFQKKMRFQIDDRNLLDIHNQSVYEAVFHTRPDLLCVVEHSYPFKMTTLMRLCAGWMQCPVFILSARMDRKWYERTDLFGPGKQRLYRDSFQSASYALTDDWKSAEMLHVLEVARERIFLTHSMKWHTCSDQIQGKIRSKIRDYWNIPPKDRKLLVLASIHNSEIYQVLRAIKNRCASGEIRVILAPHISLPPLHASAVLMDLGFTYQRWSRLEEHPRGDPEVILVDTYGDLAGIYAAADLAYVGGGFDPQYHGHNIVEAVALKIPVVIGPDFTSFRSIVDPLQENRGIAVASDFDDLSKKLNLLLMDDEQRENLSKNAYEVYRKYSEKVPMELRLLRKFLQDWTKNRNQA